MSRVDLNAFEYTAERLAHAHEMIATVNRELTSALTRANSGRHYAGEHPDDLRSLQSVRTHLLDFIIKATAFQVSKLQAQLVAVSREPIGHPANSSGAAAILARAAAEAASGAQ